MFNRTRTAVPAPPPQRILAPPPPVRASGSRKTPHEPCRNCGDPTIGNYCPTCGQRKVEVRISMRRMLMEALEDQFSINSALPRTLGALFLRPGHLTREYVAGRIVRYIPPFRLYLVSSLIFFLSLSVLPVLKPAQDGELVVGALRVNMGDLEAGQVDSSAASAARQGAGWLNDVQVNTGSTALNRMLREKLDRLNAMEPREAIGALLSESTEHVPQLMFVLLPAFAVLLKVLYLRQQRFYVEHFVFALHLHAFAFLSFTVMLLADNEVLSSVLRAWLLVYTFVAMKRVYGQGWLKTVLKYGTLGVAYNVLMAFGAVLLLLLTLLAM